MQEREMRMWLHKLYQIIGLFERLTTHSDVHCMMDALWLIRSD